MRRLALQVDGLRSERRAQRTPREEIAQERRTLAGRRRMVVPFEIRTAETVESRDASGGEELHVVGHAAIFDAWSQVLGGWCPFVERIQRGAFRKLLATNPDVPFLGQLGDHTGLPLARTSNGTMTLSEDPTGLLVDAYLNPGMQPARDVHAAIDRRDLVGMSFSFTVARFGDSWAYTDGSCYCPADTPEEDCLCGVDQRTIMEFDGLYDVAAVTDPAYLGTVIDARSAVPVASAGGVALVSDGARPQDVAGRQQGEQGSGSSSHAGADQRDFPTVESGVSAELEHLSHRVRIARLRGSSHAGAADHGSA